MALVLADRVLETTTTAGSGTITLAGAEPGYQSFSAVGDGNQTYYTITADTDWEVGIGTYTASGTTLSRDTVLSSSASGAKVTFPAGTKKVFVTYPSEKSVNRDVSGNISASSGVITNVGYPSDASDAATKLYVDTLAAQGITYHTPVKYEVPNSTGNLTATYNNGTAGVGATLTNAGTLVAFVPDGVTASISDRVLVYNQTNGFENGVYTVTVVGSGATSWVLTRATDADTYALKSPNGLGGGDAFYVTSGNTGAGETYLCNNSGVISFGSTAISFVQISAAQVYSAGNGLSLTNTVFSLATPVAVGNGGTGSSATPTNGQLLIGNGSDFTLSTLTAGSGVSITNSAGSITLSATGLGGTVTAVTATGPLASSGGTTPDISIANSTGTGSVVLDQGATISSATITAALSASITTITGSSANITTVTGTTAGFSSAAITQLSGTSAGITTVSGTTTTFSSGTITQFGATSATIATVSGTNATYSNGSFTSATVTNVSGTNLSYGSATITTGNLTFSGTGQRITGDFSNATVSNRLMFQTSTTNGNTSVRAITNGTATTANFAVHNGSDANNSSFLSIQAQPSDVLINSGITGTGTYLPMAFYTGGSERMRLDTSGRFGVGTNNPAVTLQATNTSGEVFRLTNTTANERLHFYTRNAAGTSRVESQNSDLQLFAADPNAVTLGTSNTERMRLDTSGNLLLGAASNATGIATRFLTKASAAYGSASVFESDGSAANWARTDWKNANIATPGIIYMDQGGLFAIRNDGNYPMAFYTNGANERLRITAAGDVGIGTASPDGKLDIATGGSGDVVAGLGGSFPAFTYRNGSGSWFHAGKSPTSDYFYIGYGATPTANIALVVGSAGQIGIGGANYGTSGQVLTSNGSGSAPSWQTAGGSSLKSQTFNSSGTFTVPTGVTSVWVTMTGGGGSGAAGISFDGGPSGAAGAYCIKQAVSVTAGASITVTIGGGGAGVAAGSATRSNGGRGGTTSFGSVSVTGGYGGRYANDGYAGMGGASGGTGFGANPARLPGSIGGTPGLAGAQVSGNVATWGGAGGLFGDGTDGNSGAASASAAANTGAGSGGTNSGGTTYATGNGGSGRVIVEWLG